jgi:hypothetical protein
MSHVLPGRIASERAEWADLIAIDRTLPVDRMPLEPS